MKEVLEMEFPQFKSSFDSLDQLARLVEEKSKVVNITAIRDYENIWKKHILDSLMATKISSVESRLEKGAKVLDLGTGGGFPGLPLAITHANSQFTLLDSTRKKLDAVNEFAHFVGIKNVETKWGRAEELGRHLFDSYDIVVSRAVAFLPELIELCIPFAKKGAQIVLYKLYDVSEIDAGEISANKLQLTLKEKFIYDTDRVILVYQKG